MSAAEEFNHEVSAELASLIPEDVRADPKRLEEWVNEALEFGLKAKLQTSVGIDTSVVNTQFDQWKDQVSDKLIGADSEFVTALSAWFNNSQGSFQQAFDINDKNSPLGKFKVALDSDLGDHRDAVSELVEDIQETVEEDLNEMKRHMGIEVAVKEEAQKGTGKGVKFEAEVDTHLNDNTGGVSDAIAVVGTMLIEGTPRKVGDVLSEIEAPGTSDLKIIIEVKAGSDYTMTGGTEKKKTLPDQMKESMDLRKAQASIAVVDIRNLKKKMKPYMELDKRRILVAVDRENEDFTLLDVAYSILRWRIIESQVGQSQDVASTLDVDRVQELIKEILSRLETTRAMKRNCNESSKMIIGVRSEIEKFELDIKTRANELQSLLLSAISKASQSEEE